MYYLQNRWRLENDRLVYYGLRLPPDMFKNKISLSKRQRDIISLLPCELSPDRIKALGGLFGVQVVDEKHLRVTPKSLSEATFCKSCVANDYMIPGIEFDADGFCPICKTSEKTKN